MSNAADTRRRPKWLRYTLVTFAGLVALGLVTLVGGYIYLSQDLPDAAQLADYEPPLPSHLRDVNGEPFATFARERRIYTTYEDLPPELVEAFISAEDKTFFEHGGVDVTGFTNAVFDYVSKLGSGERAVGGSTITQQVAKNLLIGDEYSVTRKLKEIILATRIEDAFTKQQILELYLNQIFLGRNAYGVQAASFAYFGKPVTELTLPEAAYLAVLPKAPANYNPASEAGLRRATVRRNYVLSEMEDNGYITSGEAAAAKRTPIEAIERRVQLAQPRLGEYYTEAVRRDLIERYGEEGEHGIYTGGLWIRGTIDPVMQASAEMALRDALVRYDRGRGWRGASETIQLGGGWPERLRELNLPVGYDDWRAAVALSKSGGAVELGFADGSTGSMPSGQANLPVRGGGGTAYAEITPGDVFPVKETSEGSNVWKLRQIPEVGGGMVVQEVSSGRVLAMVGGFDARRSQYNRATQAMRQPGSAIKPFVYAAALENGFTPASIVVDGPYCVYQGAALGQKCFRNFSGRSAGPRTMRWGLEQSRNLMTVRLAFQTGMENVVELIDDMGIGDYQPYLAMSLGAGETTVLDLVNAYAMMANGGKRQRPVLYDLIQDRNGNAIYRSDDRECSGCNKPSYDGRGMPLPADNRPQAMDARTAYQVVHMLEGVVQRGTATALRRLERPMFGKTGTTNGPTNVWFVGGTPDIVAGIYLGFDQPQNMGGYAQGGTLAAPAVRQFFEETIPEDAEKKEFRIPEGIRMVRIDRRSGKKVFGSWPSGGYTPAVIWEAFKPENQPRQQVAEARDPFAEANPTQEVRSDSDFLQQQGGIY
ncbi:MULTISPECIES: penicillin-binding protein 1A [Pacificimonas]|uniref:penicillin-binding protein 1A n=1 Tax=Pacificimonas TaxID=1960290 RepID=UPI001CCC7CAB|nr:MULTISPECIES: PBP1A family penicillin-binding protein [Pacificimonas]